MQTWWAAVGIATAVVALGACTSQDCPDERIGKVRCVGNQLERCIEDNTLQYENCDARDLVCSAENEACVHPNQLSTSSSSTTTSGAGGTGGSPASGGSGG